MRRSSREAGFIRLLFFIASFATPSSQPGRKFMLRNCNRGGKFVKTKTLMRSLGLAFLVGAFLGLAGCGTDNESESERLNKKLGEIPKTDVKGGEALPPPKTQQEYAERRQEQEKDFKNNPQFKSGSGGGNRGSGKR